MDKNDKLERVRRMATQIQATPTLRGEDAKILLKEVHRMPSREQRQQLRDSYRKMFEGVNVKGTKK